MQFDFDHEKNIVTIRLTGSLDHATLLSTLDAVVAHQEYRPGMARLWDFCAADLSSLTPRTILEMARYSTGLPVGYGDVKVVFVAERALEFGLSRIFEAYAADANSLIAVFSSVEEGTAWIVG